MHIRKATAADVPAMRVVSARAYNLDEVRLGYLPLAAGDDLGPWVARRAAWVGEHASQVMAVLLAEPVDGQFHVWSAVVDPDWQGEGHGRTLLDHAEALARDAGLAEVRLSKNVLLERTISLYEHCGYKVVGQRQHPQQDSHALADLVKAV